MQLGRTIARQRYRLVWWLYLHHLCPHWLQAREAIRLIKYGQRHPKRDISGLHWN